MKAIVKESNSNKSIIEVHTEEGMKKLVISRTPVGYSCEDYADWNISDEDYYALEEFVGNVMDLMSGESGLDFSFEGRG